MAVLVVLALGGAYVTLPWWAPTGYLRKRIADDLAGQMGVKVSIHRLRLSWARGVEIENLRIHSEPQFGPEPMIHIPRIRADFSPIDYLFRRRLAWMEVQEPAVTVRINREGDVNLAPLNRLKSDVEIDRISVQRASALVQFPECTRGLRVNVSDLQYVAGRLEKFGRMTMSADLAQTGGSAPVGLQLAASPSESPVAATAAFDFSSVDLQQLPLAKLLGLPLGRFAGRCGGSLKLQLNREGVVDQFGFDLIIRDLDVQPEAGPKLPVIEEAGFHVAARYDLFPGAEAGLVIQSARVRLPGLDLSGRARLFIGDELGLDAIKSLDFQGKIHPGRLAAVLTGRGRLPLDLHVDRPIRVWLHAGPEDRADEALDDDTVLPLHVSADATGAAVLRDDRVLKPPGRKLLAELYATLGREDWSFTVQQGKVELGQNTFLGSGGVDDLRGRLRRWRRPDYTWTLRSALADLRDMKWVGTWEITELASLRPMLPALADATLGGPISGGWSLDARKRRLVQFDLNVPAGTKLTVGPHFAKPADSDLTLVLAANLDAERSALSDLWADLRIGAARVSLSEGIVQVLPGRREDGSDVTVDFAGRFDAERIEDIVACWGPPRPRVRLGGRLEGDCSVRLSPGARAGHLSADLTDVAVAWEGRLHKPAGQKATLDVGFASDDLAAGDRIVARLRCPEARLTVEADRRRAGRLARRGQPAGAAHGVAASPPAGGSGFALGAGPATVKVRADVDDAAWLAEICPIVRRRLAAETLEGRLGLNASATWRQGLGTMSLRFDGTDVGYVSSTTPRRRKARGVPLHVWLRGSMRRGEDRVIAAHVGSAGLQVGRCQLWLTADAAFQPAGAEAAPRLYPPPNLRELDARINASLAPGRAARELLPELARLIDKHGLGGTVTAVARVQGDRESARMNASFDATDFSAEALGPLVKPAGLAAGGSLELTYHDRLSRLVLNDLFVRLGDAEVLASGSVPVRHEARGVPVRLDATSGHVVLRTRRADTLGRLLPRLKPYRLAGDVLLEAEWKDTGPGRLQQVSFHTSGLRGRYRNRDLFLRGPLLLRNVQVGEQGQLRAEAVRTDGLVFAVGANRGWVTADIRGLPAKPSGTFTLSASYLNGQEISALVGPEGAAPTTQPLTLTKAQIADLRARAEQIIARFRPQALAADLRGRVRIQRLRALDKSVGESYTTRSLAADISADHGRIQIDYASGLNGGSMRRELKVDLNDSAPMVASDTQLRDVAASKEFQPQLSKYFPGNTFDGLFSRTEEVQIALPNFVANVLDSRYPFRPTGTATTVTTDGLLIGRAVPEWAATVFPGLKFTEYRYRKMTSFANFLPDGSAKNEMVFDGATYDLHIQGATDADNIGTYTVALLLLGSPQKGKPTAFSQPVSVPLMNIRARIEGGQMLDQTVTPAPVEVFRKILIDNNISLATHLVYGAYRIFLLGKETLIPSPKSP